MQCRDRWWRSLNPAITKGPWTPEEDALLLAHIQEHGARSWAVAAKKISGRTGNQCRDRAKKLDSSITKGPWTPEEDKLLRKAVAKNKRENKGKDLQWVAIAEEVPGRTDQGCAERWRESLDGHLRKGNWTKWEISRLKNGVNAAGNAPNFARIQESKRLRRTTQQARMKWKKEDPNVKRGGLPKT